MASIFTLLRPISRIKSLMTVGGNLFLSTCWGLMQALSVMLCLALLPTPALAKESTPTTDQAPTALAFVGAHVMLTDKQSLTSSLKQVTVLVNEGKIQALLPSRQRIPAQYKKVDVRGRYLLPGLIDGHVHLAQSGGAFTRPDMIDATAIQSYADDQQWLSENLPAILRTYVQLGVTTIADMGGPSTRLKRYADLSQRSGLPEIVAAAELLSPASVPQLEVSGSKTFSEVSSAEAANDLVKRQIQQGAAIIKIVWSQETGLSDSQLSALYQEAIRTAKSAGKVVAVHVENIASAKQAIRAGVDILVHGVVTDKLDDEFIALAKQHRVSYIPTLTAYAHYAEIFNAKLSFTEFEHRLSHRPLIKSFVELTANVSKTGDMFRIFTRYMPYVDAPTEDLAKLSANEQSIVAQLSQVFSVKVAEMQRQNLRRALTAGLNVGFGTDAGNPGTLHATSILEEMRAWRQAGASNAEILRSMTLGNAVALKIDEKQGSISAGQQANFILLKDNPLQDRFVLSIPSMVVQRGHILRP